MEYTDRFLWLSLGGGIGFVLGYIVRSLREIKEEVDEIVEIERRIRHDDQIPPKDSSDRSSQGSSWELASRIALFIVVAVTVWAAFVSQKASNDVAENYRKELIARCEAGKDVRVVQRQTVDAIYTLATGALYRDTEAPPMTDIEIRQTNDYIAKVNEFRESMYRKIKPSPSCKGFVNDDNVKPPTPPYPPITREDVKNGR